MNYEESICYKYSSIFSKLIMNYEESICYKYLVLSSFDIWILTLAVLCLVHVSQI